MGKYTRIGIFENEDYARDILYQRYGGYGYLAVNKENPNKTDLFIDNSVKIKYSMFDKVSKGI
jgi:hypothetical protein